MSDINTLVGLVKQHARIDGTYATTERSHAGAARSVKASLDSGTTPGLSYLASEPNHSFTRMRRGHDASGIRQG